MKNQPKIGDEIETWFSDNPSKKSRVLKVEPYRGKYPEWFDWDVTLTAPTTMSGQIEMSI